MTFGYSGPRRGNSSISQLIHVWAQIQPDDWRKDSRTSGNGVIAIKCRGKSIYSYGTHYCMARLVQLPSLDWAVLLNSNSSSATTNKHRGIVWQATNQYRQFYVNDPSASIEDELRHARAELEKVLKTAAGSPARYRGKLLAAAAKIVDDANDLAEAFGLANRLSLPENVELYLAEAKQKSEAEAAEALRLREERERQWVADNQGGINKWCEGKANGIYKLTGHSSQFLTPEQLATRTATEEANAIAWKDHKATRGAEYEPAEYHLPNRVLLRLNKRGYPGGDPENGPGREAGSLIETSKGAEFPVDHAKRAFKVLAHLKDKGLLPYARNFDHPIRLGHFTIDKVDVDGNVTAGCHFVEWREIEDMAMRLGLMPAVVSRDTIADEAHFAGADFNGEE